MSNASAKKSERTELAWVQLQAVARIRPGAVLSVDYANSTDLQKLYVENFAGVTCVLVEHADGKTGRIPFTNVASFGVFE